MKLNKFLYLFKRQTKTQNCIKTNDENYKLIKII